MFIGFLCENPYLNPVMMARIHGYMLIGYKESDNSLQAGFVLISPTGVVMQYYD